MRRITPHRVAESVLLQSSDGELSKVYGSLPAASIEQLVRKSISKNARWILPDDGKLWVWDAADWTHTEIMEELGYESAICGYVSQKLTNDQLEVYWEDFMMFEDGEFSEPDDDDEVIPRIDPKKYPSFNRAFSKPPFILTKHRPY